MIQAEIAKRIKAQGERMTMQRKLVIEALCDLGGHQTTQHIQQHLAQQDFGLQEATIYRVLQWLKTLGIVAQTDLGQSGITYELVSMPPHHHLVCLQCGHIQDIDDADVDALRQQFRVRYDFEPRIDHMAFFGTCQQCRLHTTNPTEDTPDE